VSESQAAAAIEQANEVLREKGFGRQLEVFPVPSGVGPGRAILKGTKIVSPFSDSVETVLRVVQDCVPSAAELGSSTLRPGALRECLDRASGSGQGS
jgi:hypothetical protein